MTEKEVLQICRKYEIACPVCSAANSYFRLKPDICRPKETEGDGHPLSWRWSKPGFDSVDPKQFFFGTCQNCRFTGELDDADFRTSPKDPEAYKARFDEEELRQLMSRSSTGKGIAQSLGKKYRTPIHWAAPSPSSTWEFTPSVCRRKLSPAILRATTCA